MRKKHDKIVSSGKIKLKSMEVLNYLALTNSYISHYKFVLVISVLREYEGMKDKYKKSKDFNSSSQILIYL